MDSFASAFASAKIALSGRGIDEWVEVPVAVTIADSETLSAVEMLTYCTAPSSPLMIQPPSFSANSHSMSGQCSPASHVVL